MKRKIVLFATLAAFLSISLSSFKISVQGKARAGLNTIPGNIVNLCGSDPMRHIVPSNCNGAFIGGTGCHGSSAGNPNLNVGIAIYTDAAKTILVGGGFVPGNTYYIRIFGTFASPGPANINDTGFGFQCTVAGWKGTSTIQSPVGLANPSNSDVTCDTTTSFGVSSWLVEQTTTLFHRFLTSNNHSYEASFAWTAPSDTLTDTVQIRALLCAVNNTGTSDSDDHNAAQPYTWHRTRVGVNEIFKNTVFTAYPNPVIGNQMNIYMSGAPLGHYAVEAFDMNGKAIFIDDLNVNSGNYTEPINTTAWPAGIYQLRILKEDATHVMTVIKQ